MASDALCCCEYENKHGDRSHLLACCCDCEALDQIGDRFFKCETIPSSLIDRFLDTLSDRCRIPGLTGGGAIKVNLELATPIIIIPASLSLAAIGPITTGFILIFLPCFCVAFYQIWRKRTQKLRTKFFLVWGIFSLVFMYFLFEMVICANTNVSFIDNLIITIAVIMLGVALKLAKDDPGIIPEDKVQPYIHNSYAFFGLSNPNPRDKEEALLEDFEVVQMDDIDPPDTKPENSKVKGANWCESCSVITSPRSGHCKACDVCISNRDHHCVWIDSCVGRKNHRSFLVAMALFVFVGYYGSYLTLAAVCDPSLSSQTCSIPYAYRDFKWGLCFSGACYTILVTSIMCFGLVHQLLLISQNSTSQEMHRASLERNTKCAIFRIRNPYNRGFLQNWKEFILNQRCTGNVESV
ncbi:palmitoyltransferase ZDHHC23-B-like [Dreissena polymorpha]|uniref:Palmitoyltransferase n=1 Tax=Dreissena polymorpha TaxID=45954 RepID=A0A9D4FQF8_DREPO|nr:palmitoyltransferase ZDHHC23-B-like [Dreissena polymorpha]XP_052223692.1 palmitoyltransferase ZDHHC23-B-like [Dreissena polymorpha]KAH3801824.1 hypothetical protein DPMN_155486 [Dreissena polymorpha]